MTASAHELNMNQVPSAWLRGLRVYLGLMAGGNLIWEIVQLPLYAIWSMGTAQEQAFAVVHCTLGDLLIALSTLTLALIIAGDQSWPRGRFWPVAILAIIFGVAYTAFSEWLNVVVRATWSYSEWMPVISLLSLNIGLSPLLQWIVLPAAAFKITRGVTHVNSTLDIYAGVDTGVNTTFGHRLDDFRSGDNNKAAAFHGGIGLNNLLNGMLTILATTHIGPENPDTTAVRLACACNPNTALRYLNDITATLKLSDKLTLITDLNYIRDDGFRADGYGVAQYVVYTVNDWLKIAARGEIWRDNNAFFVAAFPGNLDFVKAEHGDPTAVVISGGRTTYGALTGGLTLTPTLPPNPYVKNLIIRPEIRYDASLNGTTPFAAGTKGSQFTFGGDIIAPFTVK